MKFEFEAGKTEKSLVRFRFNKFWGNVCISVNGKVRLRDFRMYSKELVASWDLIVGVAEQHRIRIEKIRPLLLAGFRSNTYKVYIDGKFFKEYAD